MKHAPAPWNVTGYAGENHASFSIKAGDGRGVCAIASNIKRPGVVSAANARLIAAAPELLEALCKIVRAEWTTVSLQDMTPQHRERLEAARAAIAKVEAA
jgi:hypothetical protein